MDNDQPRRWSGEAGIAQWLLLLLVLLAIVALIIWIVQQIT